jgi:hypothetical protein
MSKKLIWGLTFLISLGVMLAIYGLGLDFQFLKYEVNEQNQLVMYDGFSGPQTIVNSDVSNEQESLAVLGQYMNEFNNWVLSGILIAPFFIASYYLLFSEKWVGNKPKRKKYLSWTLAENGVVIAFTVFVWVRYYNLVNDAYLNVLF